MSWAHGNYAHQFTQINVMKSLLLDSLMVSECKPHFMLQNDKNKKLYDHQLFKRQIKLSIFTDIKKDIVKQLPTLGSIHLKC